MKTIQTHCALRLGDNLAHLHFLRGLAKKYPEIHFRHAAHVGYLQQLIDLTCDLPNLQISDIPHHKGHSVNGWKNAGGFWETHARKNDYAAFMLEWFAHLARELGLESPFTEPADLLFDYPALRPEQPIRPPFDFLVVNSSPMSGQWRGNDPVAMATLIQSLAQKHAVITTQRIPGLAVACTEQLPGFSVTNIGQLSQVCKYIVMVSTGPSWPTFNVWNRDSIELRIILIDREEIGLSKNTVQCQTLTEAHRVLRVRNLL